MAKGANVEAGRGTAAGEGGGKAGGKKKLIVGALAALVLLGGGGWFALGKKSGDAAAAKAAETRKVAPVAFVDVQEMTVNLAPDADARRPRFLRLKVVLEVGHPGIVGEVQPLLPRVQDIFQVYVRELRASDLEGSGGIHRLREELLRRVNLAVAPSRVDAVLFKEVVVQ